MQFPIDVVITWVDGSDPVLKDKRNNYLSSEHNATKREAVAAPTRFNSVGEIYWCVASIFRYAPFVRKIFIVTDGQDPRIYEHIGQFFPDVKIPIEIVDHTVIFRGYEEYLPTFNSLAIETMLWRIPGLADNYVYFNDDIILLSPITPDDWFDKDGNPVVYGYMHSVKSTRNELLLKNIYHFKHLIPYKGPMLNASYILDKTRTTYLRMAHLPQTQKRSYAEDFYGKHPRALVYNILHKVRHHSQFNPQALNQMLALEHGASMREYYNVVCVLFPALSNSRFKRRIIALQKDKMLKFLCINSFDLFSPERYSLVSRFLNNKFGLKDHMPEIDLVYTWVDGNDPQWQAKKKSLPDVATNRTDDNGVARYIDNDELRYSLRSVDMYAPWIRKIFIVTDNQVPAWLDTSNPKIEIVDHKDILPSEALPCFNSQVIEHCIHRIPGLSEHFIYANDDTFLNKPVGPSDFFDITDGLPIVRLTKGYLRELTEAFKTRIIGHKPTSHITAIMKAARLVRDRYGKYYNGDLHHNMDSFLKSSYAQVRETFDDAIAPTMVNHLRSANDVQRCIYSYAPLATGRAHLRYAGRNESFRLRIQHPHKYAQLESYNPKFFCINDSESCTDEHRRRAHEFMEQRFPTKSQFEK